MKKRQISLIILILIITIGIGTFMVTRNKHDTIEMKTSEVVQSKQPLKVKRSILNIKDQHGTLHGTLFTSNQAQKISR